MEWIKALIIDFTISAPLAAVGWFFWGNPGAIVLLILANVFFFFMAISCERIIATLFTVRKDPPSGLDISLKRVIEENFTHFKKNPRIFIFSETIPSVLVLRSLGGAGTILLSQGVIAGQPEYKLRGIIKNAIERARKPGLVVGGICGIMVFYLLKLSPHRWNGVVFGLRAGLPRSGGKRGFLEVYSAIFFLMMYPLIKFYMNMGGSAAGDVNSALRQPAFRHLYLDCI